MNNEHNQSEEALQSFSARNMDQNHLPLEFSVELNEDSNTPDPTQILSQQITLSEFLSTYSGFPYTTMVTLSHASIVPLFDFHCERLLYSLGRMFPDTKQPSSSGLNRNILYLLATIHERHLFESKEMLIVIILHNSLDSLRLRVHISQVESPLAKLSPVAVEARGLPREQPEVKNSKWYLQRKPLEACRGEGITETILVGPDESGVEGLYEGLTSNIYIITKSLELQTAPTSLVLAGSLRSVIIETCEQVGIPVIQTVPRLVDLNSAQAAFISNAFKMLVPVSRISIHNASTYQVPDDIHLPSNTQGEVLLNRLRDAVVNNLRLSATSIPSLDTFSTR